MNLKDIHRPFLIDGEREVMGSFNWATRIFRTRRDAARWERPLFPFQSFGEMRDSSFPRRRVHAGVPARTGGPPASPTRGHGPAQRLAIHVSACSRKRTARA